MTTVPHRTAGLIKPPMELSHRQLAIPRVITRSEARAARRSGDRFAVILPHAFKSGSGRKAA